MEFAWDPTKRESNLAKHGVDFADVFPCFGDSRRLIWQDTRQDYGEVRFNMLAALAGRVMHVTFTERDEATWLISARKANDREQRRYAQGQEG
jgi:uncharacterized DUF497 family protein